MDFKFNGIANDTFDFELYLNLSDHLDKSAKNYESISIPGRSDNLIIDLGTKQNKIITDTLYLIADNLKIAVDKIEEWLQKPLGYKLLEYNDGSKFYAICKGGIKVSKLYDRAAQITITYETCEVKE